jgi:Flp pilus assembly protein TadD
MALITWLAIKTWRQSRMAAFCVLFFLINIVLVLKIIPLGTEFTANRYLYLPSIGLFLWVAWGLEKLRHSSCWERRYVRYITVTFVIIVICAFSAVSFERAAVWKDSIAFWNDVISKEKNATLPYLQRSLARADAGDKAGAIADIDSALQIDPSIVPAYVARGRIKSYLKDYSGAIADFSKALELESGNPDAYHGRCVARMESGEIKGAIQDCRQATRYNPDYDKAVGVLCTIDMKIGDLKSAAADCARLVMLRPNDGLAAGTLGNAQAMTGMCGEAVTSLGKAISLGNADRNIYFNRALCRIKLGDRSGACSDWQEGAKLGDAEANSAIRKYCK